MSSDHPESSGFVVIDHSCAITFSLVQEARGQKKYEDLSGQGKTADEFFARKCAAGFLFCLVIGGATNPQLKMYYCLLSYSLFPYK